MSLRRLRLAPFVIAAAAALALGWSAGAAPGWPAHDAAHDTELVSSLRLESPAVAAGGDERIDVRSERSAKTRGLPLVVLAAALAGTTALRRRHRGTGAPILRLASHRSDALGRAPPTLLVTAI